MCLGAWECLGCARVAVQSDLCISSPCFLQTYVFVLHFIVFEFLVRCPILTSVYHTVLSPSVPNLLTFLKKDLVI